MEQNIPIEFYNLRKSGAASHPRVKTVGDLIEQLKRLPEDLPIKCDCNHGAELVVYNVNCSYGDPFLELTEVEDDMYLEDED